VATPESLISPQEPERLRHAASGGHPHPIRDRHARRRPEERDRDRVEVEERVTYRIELAKRLDGSATASAGIRGRGDAEKRPHS
jgi:hypothetical protein